jgi:DNA-3-methyladenine glycosylase II
MKKALNHLRSADPTLALVIDRIGPYKMAHRQADFWALTRSITAQQLSGKAAGTIFGRFEAACGEKGVTAERVLAMRMTTLRRAGLSRQKAEYIRDLARHTCNGRICFEDLPSMTDDEVIACLTQVKGVGIWTVQMLLMFALKRTDVLPTGDLGIRAAMKAQYDLPELPKPMEMQRIAEPWRPWRTVACWYLWRSLDGDAAI